MTWESKGHRKKSLHFIKKNGLLHVKQEADLSKMSFKPREKS